MTAAADPKALEQQRADTEFLAAVLNNNRPAMEFIASVSTVLGLWSSLERGGMVTPMTVRSGMWDAVVSLTANAFYLEHSAALHPLVRVAALDLMAAVDIERRPGATKRELQASYAARQSWVGLLLQASAIAHGPAKAASYAAAIRRFANNQPFADYCADVAAARMPNAAAEAAIKRRAKEPKE